MKTKLLLVLGAAALLAACSGKSESPSSTATSATTAAAEAAPAPAGITEANRAQAREIFGSRCTPCHGPQGGGDGPASKGLTPPPRNFTDAAWQGSVTDEHIEKIVQYGGAAVGKSPAMPPNPDLSPEVAAALREHIRSLKK